MNQIQKHRIHSSAGFAFAAGLYIVCARRCERECAVWNGMFACRYSVVFPRLCSLQCRSNVLHWNKCPPSFSPCPTLQSHIKPSLCTRANFLCQYYVYAKNFQHNLHKNSLVKRAVWWTESCLSLSLLSIVSSTIYWDISIFHWLVSFPVSTTSVTGLVCYHRGRSIRDHSAKINTLTGCW